MRAEAYYDRGNGWEKVAETFDANNRAEMYDLCQTGKARTLNELVENEERSMMPGDIIVIEDEAWIVGPRGYEEIEIVEGGEKHIDEIDFPGPAKTPIDHDRELGVI